MSKHDHPDPKPPCTHEALKFCAKCDAVECKACGKEWKADNGYAALKRWAEQPICIRPHRDEPPYRATLLPGAWAAEYEQVDGLKSLPPTVNRDLREFARGVRPEPQCKHTRGA